MRSDGGGPRTRHLHRIVAVASFIVGLGSMIVVHELAHTVAARLGGDPTASFHLYDRYAGGGFCVGCNTMDATRLTTRAFAVVSVAGVGATTAFALVLGRVGRRLRRVSVWAVASFSAAWAYAVDLPTQVIQLALVEPTPSAITRVDLVDVLGAVGRTTVADRVGLAVLGSAVSLAVMRDLRRGWTTSSRGTQREVGPPG